MTSQQGQESAQSSASNTPEVAPKVASGLDTVEKSDEATRALQGSLKSLGHEPDNTPMPSEVTVKPTENNQSTSTETPVASGETPEKPRTEFEKQQQETQEKLQNISDERQKLAEMGKQLDTKESEIKIQLETQEREGLERSKEARKALDEISNLIPDGALNPHRDALKKTLENLPDKMTAKDVADFTDRARWDAAKASVGAKDFASMSQAEKDVVLERVLKMQENNTPNPDIKLWEDAKEASGLSPDTKWENMSPVEQRLIQERVAEAKKKGDLPVPTSPTAPTSPEVNLSETQSMAPTVVPKTSPESTDTPPVEKNATPDTSKNTIQIPRTEGRTPTVVGKGVSSGSARNFDPVEASSSIRSGQDEKQFIPEVIPSQPSIEAETQDSSVDGKNDNAKIDTSLGFDQIQGKKHGDHTELDKKLSDGSTVSVYSKNGTRSINIGNNIRFADNNAYNANINISFKNDGSINEVVDTKNWSALTGERRASILEELRKLGITLPN